MEDSGCPDLKLLIVYLCTFDAKILMYTDICVLICRNRRTIQFLLNNLVNSFKSPKKGSLYTRTGDRGLI